MNVYIP